MDAPRNKREQGFTFVELLVVIVVIAILAAIAIPVFLQQREKAWAAGVHSALKNVNFAIEAYGTDQGGDYSALDGGDSTSGNAPNPIDFGSGPHKHSLGRPHGFGRSKLLLRDRGALVAAGDPRVADGDVQLSRRSA